ncbi:hypothetical protein BDV59DRAFT_203164 [Aspergillus ambiguus]|uniref:uncharacterized protein n=1 Tax=Aspergillus ambiguus TaxID=176160 RepID=UPI003CCCDBDF
MSPCSRDDVTFLVDLEDALDGATHAHVNSQERDRLLSRLSHWGISLPTSSFTPVHNPPAYFSPLCTSVNPPSPESSSVHQDKRATGDENKARSEAITLIRARTITRSSPTGSSFQDNMTAPGEPSSQASGAVLPPVALMDYLQSSRKKRSSKTRNKKQKPDKDFDSTFPNDKDSGLIPAGNANENDSSAMPHADQNSQSLSTKLSLPEPSLASPVTLGISNTSSEDKPDPSSRAKDPGPQTPKDEAAKPEEPMKETVPLAHTGPTFAAVLARNLEELEISAKNTTKGDESVNKSNDAINSTAPVKVDGRYAFKPNETTQVEHLSLDIGGLKGKKNYNDKSGILSTSEPSSNPAPSSQPSRRGSTHQKEKLPPIFEVSPDAKALSAQDSPSSGNQSLTCTPKSTNTALSAWTAFSQQSTPHTEISDDKEPKVTKGKQAQKLTITTPRQPSPSFGVANSHGSSSHAHPPSSTEVDRQGSAASKKKSKSAQKKSKFFWQLDSHCFPCAMNGCEKRCNLWDGATVICPRCGPYSEIRYCSRKHLLDDIKLHWTVCGQFTFVHPCKDSSIPAAVRNGPPLVPCLHAYDTPERHRQAVYFNMYMDSGDYFIFSDWADFVRAGSPENNVAIRCSNRLLHTIKFDNAEEKDRFRRVLATCLFMTIEVTELVDYLYRLIRDKLRSAFAPADLEAAVLHQFFYEFAVEIQPRITGDRHACETDWDGRNRRHCPDAVCRAENRRLLGSLGGKGHRQLIDYLEGCHWILRAARSTHPDVKDATARMKGEGFAEVVEEDRRVFRRGRGWDGADIGEMEIEGIND